MSSNPAAGADAATGDLRIGSGEPRTRIAFSFDGRAVMAQEGESVACALFAAGIRTLRVSPRDGAPRGMFCLMGSCQECVVWIDGQRVTACQYAVRAGLDVRSGTIER